MTYMLIAVFAIATTISISPAFAAQQACPNCGDPSTGSTLLKDVPIIIWTDSSTYDHSSVISVEGNVANLRSASEVALMVISPSNNIVTIDQIPVNSDGSFQTSLNTGGPLWKYDGTYRIKVTYGVQGVWNHAFVDLTGGIITAPKPTTPTVTDLTNQLDFDITGGEVISIKSDTSQNSLMIKIIAVDDGELTITLPKDVIKPMDDGMFFVLVNGEEIADSSQSGLVLTIPFEAGTEEIEIVGGWVIPEFGTIAAMILAIAIISIIAVSARTKLSILPKF